MSPPGLNEIRQLRMIAASVRMPFGTQRHKLFIS